MLDQVNHPELNVQYAHAIADAEAKIMRDYESSKEAFKKFRKWTNLETISRRLLYSNLSWNNA